MGFSRMLTIRTVSKAVLTAFALVAASAPMAPGMAAAETASQAKDVFVIAVSSNGQVTTKPSASVLQHARPGTGRVVNLPGKSPAGVNTTITCDVYVFGPETFDGRVVDFEVLLSCNGGVPSQLGADLDIYRYQLNEWQLVPKSHTPCGTLNSPVLTGCVAHAPCLFPGNYYYGYAHLHALDELGVQHEAELWTIAVPIACTTDT
jgi:hypothetical protein